MVILKQKIGWNPTSLGNKCRCLFFCFPDAVWMNALMEAMRFQSSFSSTYFSQVRTEFWVKLQVVSYTPERKNTAGTWKWRTPYRKRRFQDLETNYLFFGGLCVRFFFRVYFMVVDFCSCRHQKFDHHFVNTTLSLQNLGSHEVFLSLRRHPGARRRSFGWCWGLDHMGWLFNYHFLNISYISLQWTSRIPNISHHIFWWF